MSVNMKFVIKEKIFVAVRDDGGNFRGTVIHYDEREEKHKVVLEKIKRAKAGSDRQFYLDNTPLKRVKIVRAQYSGRLWYVLDPRGFTVEVGYEDVERILKYCSMDNGVVTDECVWASGNGLHILPKSSPEYTAAVKATKVKATKISIKNIQDGNKILLGDGKEVNYLGKFPIFDLFPSGKSNMFHELQRWSSFLGKTSSCHVMTGIGTDELAKVLKNAPQVSAVLDSNTLTPAQCQNVLETKLASIGSYWSSPLVGKDILSKAWLPKEAIGAKYNLKKIHLASSIELDNNEWYGYHGRIPSLGKGIFLLKGEGEETALFIDRTLSYSNLSTSIFFKDIGNSKLRCNFTSQEKAKDYFVSIKSTAIKDIVSHIHDKEIDSLGNIMMLSEFAHSSNYSRGYSYNGSTKRKIAYDSAWQLSIVDENGALLTDFS